jgi:hypothetical protein
MAFGSWLRPFGLSSFIGGLLVALAHPWLYIDPASFIATYLNYIGYLLIAFGLIGLCLAHYKDMGVFSFFSFTILFFGMSIWLGFKWFQTFVVADLLKSAPELMDSGLHVTLFGTNLALHSLMIGLILFAGISVWKGFVSPWGSSLLLIGAIAEMIKPFLEMGSYESLVAPIIIGIAFSWLGCSLFLGKHEEIFENPSEDTVEDLLEDITEEKQISKEQMQTEMGSS